MCLSEQPNKAEEGFPLLCYLIGAEMRSLHFTTPQHQQEYTMRIMTNREILLGWFEETCEDILFWITEQAELFAAWSRKQYMAIELIYSLLANVDVSVKMHFKKKEIVTDIVWSLYIPECINAGTRPLLLMANLREIDRTDPTIAREKLFAWLNERARHVQVLAFQEARVEMLFGQVIRTYDDSLRALFLQFGALIFRDVTDIANYIAAKTSRAYHAFPLFVERMRTFDFSEWSAEQQHEKIARFRERQHNRAVARRIATAGQKEREEAAEKKKVHTKRRRKRLLRKLVSPTRWATLLLGSIFGIFTWRKGKRYNKPFWKQWSGQRMLFDREIEWLAYAPLAAWGHLTENWETSLDWNQTMAMEWFRWRLVSGRMKGFPRGSDSLRRWRRKRRADNRGRTTTNEVDKQRKSVVRTGIFERAEKVRGNALGYRGVVVQPKSREETHGHLTQDDDHEGTIITATPTLDPRDEVTKIIRLDDLKDSDHPRVSGFELKRTMLLARQYLESNDESKINSARQMAKVLSRVVGSDDTKEQIDTMRSNELRLLLFRLLKMLGSKKTYNWSRTKEKKKRAQSAQLPQTNTPRGTLPSTLPDKTEDEDRYIGPCLVPAIQQEATDVRIPAMSEVSAVKIRAAHAALPLMSRLSALHMDKKLSGVLQSISSQSSSSNTNQDNVVFTLITTLVGVIRLLDHIALKTGTRSNFLLALLNHIERELEQGKDVIQAVDFCVVKLQKMCEIKGNTRFTKKLLCAFRTAYTTPSELTSAQEALADGALEPDFMSGKDMVWHIEGVSG